MRVNERYQDVKSGQITELLFLEEARKDGTLRKFISNRNTFEEAVIILKNKGLLFEGTTNTPEKIDFFKMFNEGIAAWEVVEEDKSAEVNAFEFEKGWRYEFVKAGKTDDKALDKAKEKAITNIKKDAIFYTKLELVKDSVEHQKKRTDQPLDISKGQNLVDKDNQSKPVKVKVEISSEEYLKAAEEKERAALNEGVSEILSSEDEKGFVIDMTTLKIVRGFDNLTDAIDYATEKNGHTKTDKNSKYLPFRWKDVVKMTGLNPRQSKDWVDYKESAKKKSIIDKLKSVYQKVVSEDKLPGGEGDKLKPEDVDPKELEMGTQHEMEHTKDKEIAQEIALDHLSEDPKYYIKLKTAGIDEGVFSSDPLGKLKGKEVSFTTKNGDQLNSISSKAVSSKLDKGGAWIITLAGNQTLAITKDGTKGVYFKTKDQHEKVADLGQDLKAAADKVFKGGSLKEGTIDRGYKFYILKGKRYFVAGFNKSEEAATFIKDHANMGLTKVSLEDLSKVTELNPDQDKNWKRLSGINDFMFKMNEAQLKEQIKAVLREKLLKEYTGSLPTEEGPDVDKKTLEHELKNYDWYWQNSDDAYLKKLAQQRDDKVRKLVGKMGKEGEDLYNEYAPDDLKWGTAVKEAEEPIQNQKIKDAKDKSPEELAKDVLSKQIQGISVINCIAYIKIWNEKNKTPDMEDALEILEKLPIVIKFKQKQGIK